MRYVLKVLLMMLMFLCFFHKGMECSTDAHGIEQTTFPFFF